MHLHQRQVHVRQGEHLGRAHRLEVGDRKLLAVDQRDRDGRGVRRERAGDRRVGGGELVGVRERALQELVRQVTAVVRPLAAGLG